MRQKDNQNLTLAYVIPGIKLTTSHLRVQHTLCTAPTPRLLIIIIIIILIIIFITEPRSELRMSCMLYLIKQAHQTLFLLLESGMDTQRRGRKIRSPYHHP